MPDALPPVLGAMSPTDEVNRALALDRAGAVAEADLLWADLRRRLPEWDEIHLRLAERCRRAGDMEGAIAAYGDALERNPGRFEALLGLGALLLPRGEVKLAEALFLRCCGVAPDRAEAWDALGTALLMAGDHRAAEAAFAEATRLAPADIGVALRRIDAVVACGAEAEEAARLDVALAGDADNPALLTARAALAERAGDRALAIDLLELATVLAPEAIEPQAQFAQLLVRANRVSEALSALDRAIELAPDDVTLRNNRAATLLRLHRFGEALDSLSELRRANPKAVGILNNLSNALVSLGRQDEGVAVAAEAVAAEPGTSLGWRALCNALPYAEGIGGAELLSTLRRAAAVVPRGESLPFINTREPERPLEIGLLSPTLKTHPVGWLTVAGFEALDPARFRLHCLGPTHGEDAIHRRFRAVAASWTRLDGMAPEAIVDACRRVPLDMVIDLGGHGDQGLMTLCARRLAPVQIKWVGSQNHSTGLPEMDWFITDIRETPAGFERYYSERLLRLPDGYVCYSPPSYAPDVTPLPALASGVVTFGCLNNLAKITQATLDTWAAVMRAVPGSRMMIACHQVADAPTRERLVRDFAARGIGADRLDLRAGAPHRAQIGRYGEIDIVLDPFPYSGGLTTCEALWMGAPVVTVPGETFASRHSASHLGNAGLGGWVARDLEDYVAIAVRWARDLDGLAALRAGMREQVRRSPLCDAPRFGRNLGDALRHAWREWCGQ